jgi:hypothetical protein
MRLPIVSAAAAAAAALPQVCNMELLNNVRALASDLLASGANISLLVNNAGRYIDEAFTVTKEGIEHTMALDYFGALHCFRHGCCCCRCWCNVSIGSCSTISCSCTSLQPCSAVPLSDLHAVKQHVWG